MNNRTEISSLGEFGLIEHLTKNIEFKNASSVLGVGDDAAILDQFGKQTVITTDLLIEGVHFDLMYSPLKHLGYKSVIVNLSDIYAMNAIPTQILLSLGISSKFSIEALDDRLRQPQLVEPRYFRQKRRAGAAVDSQRS